MSKLLFLVTFLIFAPIAIARDAALPQTSGTIPSSAELADKFNAQMAALVKAYRDGDEATGRQLLGQFRLPNSQDWFSEHLSEAQAASMAVRYDRLYANFAQFLEQTVKSVVAQPMTDLITNPSQGHGETPTPPFRDGAKPSGMVSVEPTNLTYVHFGITVNRSPTTSWAETFTFQGGAFRFLGFGDMPFWVWQDGGEGSAPTGGAFSTPPVVVSKTPAVYPSGAVSRKIGGVVVIDLLIDEKGEVKKSTVLEGDPLLRQAALDAVQKWLFKPATLGGATIESRITVKVDFVLPGSAQP